MGHALSLRLEPAGKKDARFLWRLRNESEVRRQSFSSAAVAYADHRKWLEKKLADRRSALFVLRAGRRPVGQIRFDAADGKAVVNLAVAASARGRGFGSAALAQASRLYAQKSGIPELVGFVKKENRASRRCFEKAGYAETGVCSVKGARVRRFVYRPIPTVTWRGLKLPKLALGTAQLGMDYGIANRTGKPGPGEIECMVGLSLAAGCDVFDTGQDYGESEEMLGHAFRRLGACARVKVVTKISGNSEGTTAIEDDLRRSVRKLGVPRLFSALFHSPAVLEDWPRVRPAARRILESGLAESVGVSIYETRHFERALRLDPISVIQVPFNVFDQRARTERWFERAAARKKLVMVRSVYLQGALLLDAARLPAALSFAKDRFQKFARLASKAGLSARELALGFALRNSEGALVLVGAETAAQISDNLRAATLPGPRISRELFRLGDRAPEFLIFPYLWKTA